MLSHKIKADNTKPNVIIILTDQQRHDAVGYLNDKVITPNLNALAKNSIVCTNAFVQSPQCQPSRASILTGRYPTAHKVWWNETYLSKSEKTIGNIFKDAGYNTGYFGKFHVENDMSYPLLAKHFGWDHVYLLEDWQRQVAVDTFEVNSAQIRKEFYGPMSNKTWTGSINHKRLHHEEVITDRAVEYIKNAEDPFMIIVSYHGPHPPYAAPDEFTSLYQRSEMSVPSIKKPNLNNHQMTDDEWRELKIQYFGAISWIDDNIGRILQVAGDSIIVFMSDHGDMLGDHGEFSKGIYAYDGNTRIPLLIKLPRVSSRQYTHFVQGIDILPTMLQACNLSAHPGIQGHSLVDAFIHNNSVNNEVVSMLCHSNRLRMIRTDAYKYWIYGSTEYLFDLNEDPEELNNVAYTNVALLQEARFRLLRKLIECEDPLPIPRPIH